MHLQCDVSRLLRRYEDKIHHTGIDRVNLDYAKWVINSGGGMCIQRGRQLESISRAMGEILLARSTTKEAPPQVRQPSRVRSLRNLLSTLTNIPNRQEVPESAIILNTSHAWLERLDVWDWLLNRGGRVFTFIHDLIPIEFPEYVRPVEKVRHMRRITNTLRYSRGIVVNSKYTESSLMDFAKESGLALPPTLVAPLGHNLEAERIGPLPPVVKAPYFLFLGTIEPRKNHLLILTVWRELARRMGSATPQLVVVGRRGWECEQIIDLLDRCEALRPHVRELNEASDELVAALIRGARALLLPSFAEGFGMPVQEALAVGTPVIASPLPTFLEIAGEIPDYAETFDGVRWLHLIMDYASPDSMCRENQLERMRSFRQMTWEAHFKLLEAFLEAEQ